MPRERSDTLDSRTVSIGPGSRAVEAAFGERKLTLRRERFAETLFRSCGLGTVEGKARGNLLLSNTTIGALGQDGRRGWDFAGAASVCVGGQSFRSSDGGGRWPISSAVVQRNTVVEHNTQAISVSKEKRPTRRASRDGLPVLDADKGPMVDSKALAAEIDSVAAELRNMIAGVDTELTGGGVSQSGAKSEANKDDDEEEGGQGGQHARLLRYRYVRKIEAPVPPLEPLEDTIKFQRQGDKMDLNLQSFRIRWARDAQERAQHWNQETNNRLETARSRREEDTGRFESTLLQQLSEKAKKIPLRVEALRAAQVERLKAKSAAREEKVEQVRRRREEEQLAKEQRLRDSDNSHSAERAERSREALLQQQLDQQHRSPGDSPRKSSRGGLSPEQDVSGPQEEQDGAEEAAQAEEESAVDWFQSFVEEEEADEGAAAEQAAGQEPAAGS